MFSGARYTLELRSIVESPNICLFDFDYDFYDEQFRCDFEDKFIAHYYFDEIGFETVARFKQRLRSHLNKKMPYYTQLYRTELEAENISFLLNKDLRETFIRTLDTTDNIVGSTAGTSNNNNKGTTETENHSYTDEKISNVADGVASASLTEGYLTGVGHNESYGTDHKTEDYTTVGNTTGNSKEDRTGKETEKTEMISQGNIGITSSAEFKKISVVERIVYTAEV